MSPIWQEVRKPVIMFFGVITGFLMGCFTGWAEHHCFFLFHRWDRTRMCTDSCVRCGAIRFKR